MRRILFSLTSVVWVLALGVPVVGQTAKVTLKAESEVDAGQMVTIADVATIAAPASLAQQVASLSISGAPLPGTQRTISASYIKLKLRSAKLDDKVILGGADKVSIKAQGLTVSSEELVDEARNYILGQLPSDNRTYDVTVSRTPRAITTTPGEYQVKTRLMSSSIRLGNNTVAIDLVVDGKSVATTSASLDVKATADVLVTKETLSSGSAISLQNVSWEQRDITRTPDAITMPEGGQVPAWVAKRTLNSGTIVTSKDIALPPAVNMGDTVTLIVRCGKVTLRATAQCRDNGGIGDAVRVRSSASSEDVRALVVQPGTVEIVR